MGKWVAIESMKIFAWHLGHTQPPEFARNISSGKNLPSGSIGASSPRPGGCWQLLLFL